MTRRPAALGGPAAFRDPLPLVRPSTPALSGVTKRLSPSYDLGILTNGPLTRELEERTAEWLGVPHVVAVASCTAGLMLAIQALRPKHAVVLPSFTFSASAHAVAWNGLVPRFAECEAGSFQLDVNDAETRLGDAGGILATHVFGAPCDAQAVEGLARKAGAVAVFDAAHAFGARRAGRPIGGFGDAEVFSLSPTKPLIAGEGGLVATAHDDVAATIRIGRDYGNGGDYDTRFPGLNARMSELHAAVALESLGDLEENLTRRRAIADAYCARLREVPGLHPQLVHPNDESTYKDFTVSVDADEYGMSRNHLSVALGLEGIDSRPYFFPPVHRHQAYANLEAVDLPTTDAAAGGALSLPIFPGLPLDAVDAVVETLSLLHVRAEEVTRALTP